MRSRLLIVTTILSTLVLFGCGGSSSSDGLPLAEQYRRAMKNPSPESRAGELIRVAKKQHKAGDLAGAEQSLRDAAKAAADVKLPLGQASSLNAVARQQGRLGMLDAADTSIRQVRELLPQIDDPASQAVQTARMAVTLSQYLDKESSAEIYLNNAEELSEQAGSQTGRISSLLEIAKGYHRLDKTADTDRLTAMALELARNAEDPRTRCDGVTAVAVCLTRIKQTDRAQQCFDEAIELAGKIDNATSHTYALAEIARRLHDSGQDDRAREVLAQAEKVADTIAEPDQKKEARKQIQSIRRKL